MDGQATATGLRIRAATEEDVPAIVALHIGSWQWAYRGLLPDRLLDGLDAQAERREAGRRARFTRPPGEDRTWVAELDGRVIGFAETGRPRDEDATPDTAELFMIYLAQEAAGKGIGRALFAHAVDDLRARGFARAVLWVLDTNARARRFYEAAGWRPDGKVKTEMRGATELNEVRYAIDLAGGEAT